VTALDPGGGLWGSSETDDDLLTRSEASDFLVRYGVRLKPSSLAKMWSLGVDGPACRHVRGKPFYPRGVLREWALAQDTGLRNAAPVKKRRRS